MPSKKTLSKPDEHASDHTLGQSLIAPALELLGERIKHLLIDRGFLDGEWRKALRICEGSSPQLKTALLAR